MPFGANKPEMRSQFTLQQPPPMFNNLQIFPISKPKTPLKPSFNCSSSQPFQTWNPSYFPPLSQSSPPTSPFLLLHPSFLCLLNLRNAALCSPNSPIFSLSKHPLFRCPRKGFFQPRIETPRWGPLCHRPLARFMSFWGRCLLGKLPLFFGGFSPRAAMAGLLCYAFLLPFINFLFIF